MYDIPSTVVYGDKTLALTLDGKRTGISRKHFLGWAAGMGLPERAAVQVVELALKASGPLLADLSRGRPFAARRAAPLPGPTAAPRLFRRWSPGTWVKELKHRRRLMEG